MLHGAAAAAEGSKPAGLQSPTIAGATSGFQGKKKVKANTGLQRSNATAKIQRKSKNRQPSPSESARFIGPEESMAPGQVMATFSNGSGESAAFELDPQPHRPASFSSQGESLKTGAKGAQIAGSSGPMPALEAGSSIDEPQRTEAKSGKPMSAVAFREACISRAMTYANKGDFAAAIIVFLEDMKGHPSTRHISQSDISFKVLKYSTDSPQNFEKAMRGFTLL